jgi:hypothetical protein
MGIVESNPLTLTLYPGIMHDRDISEDPMVEEFAASLVGSRIVAWPFLERLSSPLAPLSYRMRPRQWWPHSLRI